MALLRDAQNPEASEHSKKQLLRPKLGTAGYKRSITVVEAFVKLRKATFSFVMSCPSVRMEIAPHPLSGRIFMKFDIRIFFQKCVQKIEIPLKSNKHNR